MKSLRDVRIVSYLFIAFGILSVLGVVEHGRISVTTGALGVPIGIGLMRFRSAWRKVALTCLWLAMIVSGLGVVVVLANGVVVNLFGVRAESRLLPACVVTVLFLTMFWQYRVLTRLEVQCWFDRGESSAV
jgi:hypothetical protein